MVLVFGSINVDLVSNVERFPSPGETLSGKSFAILPGGKGANQALAAKRAGAQVRLHGAVGCDAFADPALELLAAGGVALDGVAKLESPTGCATILVDTHGENCIVVVAGANEHVDPASVADSSLLPDTVVVLQQEVPTRANDSLVRRARARGARIVLNAAPARPVDIELLRAVDVLVVNEDEAIALARAMAWPSAPGPFAIAASSIGTAMVVVTLGKQGALCRYAGETWLFGAPAVDAVDSTGAGDAFVGALAAALDRGAPPAEALSCAVAGGSLACRAHGAQPSLPHREAIEALRPAVASRRQ